MIILKSFFLIKILMNYYEVLGLEKDCTESDIKKAYYKLARLHHPDKVEEGEKEEATKKFQKIGEAYSVLSDPEKRKNYQFKKERKKKEEPKLAEVSGKVVYINSKNRKIFHIFAENTKKKFECMYEGFFPIQKGDAILGFAEYTIYRKREFLRFTSPPFVVIGTDKETILENLTSGLRESKNSKKIFDIYRIILKKCGMTEEKIPSLVDSFAIHYNYEKLDYDPYISFSLLLNKISFIKLVNHWYKNRILRNLYLLGLNNKEIQNSKMNPLKLYDQCLSNPYIILSLSLEKCGKIFQRLGKLEDKKLIECGRIVRKIESMMNNGWTGVPTKTFVKIFPNVSEYLPILKNNFDVKCEYNTIYLNYAYEVEVSIVKWIKKLLSSPPIFSIDDISFTRNDLSKEQKIAVQTAFKNNVSIITGAGGSGKTSTLKELIYNLEKNEISYRVGSFTGKAVSRIREVTGKKEPATLNKMISTEKKGGGKEGKKFKCLILDESSMITSELLCEFKRCFSHDYKLIFVGDVNQLPPISWGSIFEALIKSKIVPTTILKYVHRTENSQDNGILLNANRIIMHKDPEYNGPEFDFEITNNFKIIPGNIDTVNSLIKILNNKGVPSSNLIVISPYNKDLEIINYNCSSLYNDLNRSQTDARGKIWRIGDRVMHTDNNYTANLTNGDEGIVVDLDASYIKVKFKEGAFKYLTRSISKEDEEEKELNTHSLIHSFAVSVHRYQGSEIDYVIGYIPEGDPNSTFLNLNLLYTLITRCKKMIWLIGDVETIIRAATTKSPWRCCNLLKRFNEN
jgi:exodeoxyribonuclease V alpha subunit